MQRPIDSVTAAVLNLETAQRKVNALIKDVIEGVSADPPGQDSLPHVHVKLSELRGEVDQAVDELIDALARMGEEPSSDSD